MELDSPSPPSSPNESPNVTTTVAMDPAQRIRELNEIDTSISLLLRSASTATSILSNQSSANTTSPSTLSAAKEAFTSAAQTYFSTLSSIEVRLRRQVYALEEAGLITSGDERDARRGRTLNMDDGVRGRGGGGPLDPSWLNVRVEDGVELQKKRELLAEGKDLVDRIRKREGGDMDLDGRENAGTG